MWCRMLDKISGPMAFFPPSPPTYEVDRHGDGGKEAYVKPTLP